MKTSLSDKNPFKDYRLNWAYGFEFIKDGARLLDYGCHDGDFIERLSATKKVSAYGVDKDIDVVAGKRKDNIVHISKAIPFTDRFFDVVTMFDVVEHIYDQKYVLNEVNRVLKENGMLIVTVPRKNIFSFLDVGNLKYRFPGIHKFWYLRRHSLDEYDRRYLNNPSGLIGNVEKEKAWHQHFEKSELFALLGECGFSVVDFDGVGRYAGLMGLMGLVGLGSLIPEWFVRWQALRYANEQLYCIAEKRSPAANNPSPSGAG